MERIKIAPHYSEEFIEIERPSPMSDQRIDRAILDVMSGNLDRDFSPTMIENFKRETKDWILSSKLNNLKGLESFNRIDVMSGCTQFIDNVYMQRMPQIIDGDYRYHFRLGNWPAHINMLHEQTPLVIAMPFPQVGAPHSKMNEILDECLKKQIPVHIDGAWITCCRDVDFNFDHPAIKSVGISLSKGLGLGWNRVGLRWTREFNQDSITIMNDFNMLNKATLMIGLHFIRNFEPDYLWNHHGDNYYKVCKDFNLTPTNSIYLAMKDGHPIGISPLLRYLENERI